MTPIPRSCYKYPSGVDQIRSEGIGYRKIERIDCEGPILNHMEGYRHPWKGFVSEEALFAVNQVKSLIIQTVKVLSRKQFILGTVYSLLTSRELDLMVASFNAQAFRIISPYILKDRHITASSLELKKAATVFLSELGAGEAERFAEIFVHVLEYDNAYRYRLLDLCDATSKERLGRREILRLISIIRERDSGECAEKYVRIARILAYGLWFPKVRRSFGKMIDCIDFCKMKSDNVDRYWMFTDPDYDFHGLDYQTRLSISKHL